MDLRINVKEEPVWSEASTSHESVELLPEMIAVKQEIKSELQVPTEENEFKPSPDIKQEVFIEQRTISELVPYIKEEDKMKVKGGLSSHMKTHSGERSFRCSMCNKLFSQRCNLQVHMRMHTGERLYKCEVCGKSFFRADHLICHKKTHAGERPYKCAVCSKKFTQESHLSLHIRSHSGERPYGCTVCGKTFADKGNRTKHLKTHLRKS